MFDQRGAGMLVRGPLSRWGGSRMLDQRRAVMLVRWLVTCLSRAPSNAGEAVREGARAGKLFALNATTGATKWQASVGSAVRSPVVAGGLVYKPFRM